MLDFPVFIVLSQYHLPDTQPGQSLARVINVESIASVNACYKPYNGGGGTDIILNNGHVIHVDQSAQEVMTKITEALKIATKGK